MIEFLSWEFFIGLILMASISIPLILYCYNKYYKLKHDEGKSVFLIDFNNHLKLLGKFDGYDTRTTGNHFVINVQTEVNEVEDWTIELDNKYTFGSVSRDYDKVLLVYCNFAESNFEERRIKPLFDIEIIKFGLEKGLDAIKRKTSPLIEQIEYFKKEIMVRDRIILDSQATDFSARLKFIKAAGLLNNRNLDEYQNEFLIAPAMVNVRQRNIRQKYLKSMENAVNAELGEVNNQTEELLNRFQNDVSKK